MQQLAKEMDEINGLLIQKCIHRYKSFTLGDIILPLPSIHPSLEAETYCPRLLRQKILSLSNILGLQCQSFPLNPAASNKSNKAN